MLVNIERAIKSITEHIDFLQPLYEAIINSFQANADKVEVFFEIDKDQNVIGYEIKDNGEGFTKENIESFLTLWSNHKINIGALGSGRIMCLKVFDNINIESQTKDMAHESGIKTNIKFNRKFLANTIEDIKPTKNHSNTSYTKTTFKEINEAYLEQISTTKYDLKYIEDEIFINILPMFIRFFDEKKEFEILINNNLWINKQNLEDEFNKQKFETKKFNIKTNAENDCVKEVKYEFCLFYRVSQTKDDKDTLKQFYGASDRYVKSFSSNIRIEKLKNGYSGIFCLTSDYFESRVKDSRKDFVIPQNESNPSKENPITFPEINTKLKEKLDEILKEKFPEIEKELEEKKEKIVNSFPHLGRYIKEINSLTISESNIIKQAEEEFNKERKKTRKKVEEFTERLKKNKDKFDEKKFQEITNQFTQVGKEQLADYIGYRQTIIDMLLEIYEKTSLNKLAFDEADIHNLFMPKSKTSNDLFTYSNNVWIFDDKFMSYAYSASNKTIEKIVSDVTGKSIDEIAKHHKNQKPDLVMFYSNPEDEYKDVLLIEFKRLNNELSEKKKAITQLQDYPMYIRKNIENIRSIFSYTIIDIDESFREWLTDSQSFDEYSFGDSTNKISSYYRYMSGRDGAINAHLHVIEFSQVLHDADKRNNVFLDILKQSYKQDKN